MLVFDIHELKGFTDRQEELFIRLLDFGTQAINSSSFANAISKYNWMDYKWTWRGKSYFTRYKFHDTEDSNEIVVEKLFSGADEINVTADSDVDLTLEMYYANNNVVGHTSPDTQRIFLNKAYYDERLVPGNNKGQSEIFENIIHEYMHKIGYSHSFLNNRRRPHSVPYAVGGLAGNFLYRKLMETCLK